MSVKQILERHDIQYLSVTLGEVELMQPASAAEKKKLNGELQQVGFELLDAQRTQQIEKIKTLLTEVIQSGEVEEHFTISRYLTAHLHKDYSHLSKLFSQVEGVTIEQFFILQKIEKAKEFLIYNQLNLNEISMRLGYTTVQHLSSQFKKVTGMTPGKFKQNGSLSRKPIDQINNK